jgi:hypothetical protein
MIHKLHREVEIALERCHSELHARNLQITPNGPNRYRGACVFKDDGAKPRGIPPIPYSFEFTAVEDWDAFIGTVWKFLENKKKELGFN